MKARKGNHHLVARMIENVQQEIREDETFRKNSLGKCTSWCWEGLEEDPEYMYIESIDELSERKAKMNSLLSHPTRNMRFNEPQPKILEESAAAFGHQHEVREIASVLQGLAGVHLSVPLSTAGVLLRHFRWNTDRLIRSFESDPMGTCQQAGISMSELHPMIPVPSNHNSQKSLYCPICMENLPNSNSVGLALMCGHWFCKNCWSGYLKSQISHGPICIYATCPAPDCRLVCHEDLWHEILKDNFSDSLERYSTFLVRSYIDLHPSIKWCGSPKCNKAVLYTGTAELDVRCACGFQMCFKCGQASHSPASCEEARQWRSKCDGDGKDLNFILKTSKQCPRCGVAIHRESGCNHIRCKICTHEFCWLCLGPWSRHGDATGGFYQCNLFDPTKDSKESIPGIRGKESMGKFLHYYSRYENHEEAQLFADSKQSQIRSHLAEQKDDYLEMKMELLITALEEIIECRRVLKYSYVHVYYLQDGPQKIFFEHLQEMLEKSTEYLQELVEQPEEIAFQIDIDFEQVRNYTKLTRNFARRVVEAVGLAEIERKADIEDQEVNKTKLLNF